MQSMTIISKTKSGGNQGGAKKAPEENPEMGM